ncbi:GGDEF domain-containing protein [Saccharospirillum impatiens]|uniref:GGDEF domain-containing protein n=1 Tax=Saccharospirillum impatiens TaxID=169438 RepID=UPI00041381E4|nr:GGDEF domain-containing protein [Saccharospirillum impatiens]
MRLGSTPEQIDLKRTLVLMRFFAVSGNLIMVPFALLAIWQGIWVRFWILLLVICVITTLVTSAHVRQQAGGERIALAIVMCLFALYLTMSGGQDGTGVYFSFTLIPMMIVIAGWRTGQLLGGFYSLVVIAAILIDLPGMYPYDIDAQPRLIAATLFIVLLSLLIEWTHVQSYLAIKHTADMHRKNSLTDPLTGLMNRLGLERQLLKWKQSDQHACVALIDIDHFKAVNDRYGHDVGDRVLTTFAKVLRNNLKETDSVCRWGGEEFVLVLMGLSETEARPIVDELRKLVAGRRFQFDEINIDLQFSAGLAAFKGVSEFKRALKLADQRVYQAKSSGRNRVVAGDNGD